MAVGRGVFWKKSTVGVAWQLDMARFAKDVDLERAGCGQTIWKGNLDRNATIGWQVRPPYRLRLCYTITKRDGKKIDCDYWVALDTTPCYYGGKRWWFICPNTNCGRRCRILYQVRGSDYFLCRTCQNLTYRSQQEGLTKAGALFEILFDGPALQSQMLTAKTQHKRRRAERRFWHLFRKAQPLLIHGRKR